MGAIYQLVGLPRLTTKHSQLSEFSDPPRLLLRPESHPDHSEVEEELQTKYFVMLVWN